MPEFVKVEGLAELTRRLNALAPKLRERIMTDALTEGGADIKEEAQRLCRVDRGDLRDSLQVRLARKSADVEAYVTAGGTRRTRGIAHLVEFGTGPHWIAPRKRGVLALARNVFAAGKVWHPGARPYPFMRPAFDRHANVAVQLIAGVIRRRLKECIA